MAAASARDLLLPQPPGGLLRGGALALLAHAAMFLALTTVLQWRVSTPEAVVAELWSALPQQAAPPPPPPARPEPPAPPPPPPPPLVAQPSLPDPQIAIAQAERDRLVQEKLERDRLERQRLERERVERQRAERAERERVAKAERERAEQERLRKQREAERKALAEAKRREQLAREQKEAEERLAEQRQKNLERLMGQAGAGATDGSAAQSSGPSASYTARLVGAIKPNIVFTETIRGNPAAEVEVRAGASGSIIARRLVRSSGNADWDEAVLRAIDRTGTLPRDVDGRVPPVLTMVFRPQE